MEFSVVLRKTLQLSDGVAQARLGREKLLLRIRLGGSLADNLLLKGSDCAVGVGDECFIADLRLHLGRLGGLLEVPCLEDELLDHLHNSSACLVGGVLLLGDRRSLLGAALCLKEVVVGGETIESLLQDGDGHGLVGDGLLEVEVLLFAVLSGSLEIQLVLGDHGVGVLDLGRQGLDGCLQRGTLGFQFGLEILSLGSGHLGAVELVLAPIVLLHLVFHLLLEGGDHAVNRLLHLRESIQLGGACESQESGVASLLASCAQQSSCPSLLLLLLVASRRELEEEASLGGVGAAHGIPSFVLLEDLDSLGNGLHLL
mmetsp:Transcript_30564/g.46137  ORF Transcript_30564/g.46137 Transcript_30564/m.46137 type:complete len:314 (+) Transcript_30564:205-1146(+)